MPFRILNNQAEVKAYRDSLNARWPERHDIARHISAQLGGLLWAAPHVVELCCGPGVLAAVLLTAHPSITYTGLDISATSLKFAHAALARFADRTNWIQADLNTDDWQGQLSPPIHAIVSMQSLHDLGSEANVARHG